MSSHSLPQRGCFPQTPSCIYWVAATPKACLHPLSAHCHFMSELSWAGACSWRVSHILPTSLLPLLFLAGEGKVWFLLRRALAGDPEPLTIWRNIFIQTSGSISGTARFLLCSPLLRCSCSRLFSSPFPKTGCPPLA